MKLSQIQVHEVSLVDKAANKRRYLLYKRDGEAPKPEDVLKSAGEALDAIIALFQKWKDQGGPNQGENYAQQAKDLLSDRWPKLVSHWTDEERSALAKTLAKSEPPPKDDKAKAGEDDLDLTPEEIEQIKSLDAAVTNLQQQLAETKK